MALIRSRNYWLSLFVLVLFSVSVKAQDTTVVKHTTDTVLPVAPDTSLRIINLNPYITLHVDSAMTYNLDINKDSSRYFWFLKNAPVGLRINKDDGVLSFKAEKSYFLSGRLKYDQEYKVYLGVQNLANPSERVDTSFSLVFYNTEIVYSQVKPSVSNVLYIDEGDTLNFKVQCETGSFPIESITTLVSTPLRNYNNVTKCNEAFVWPIPYDFVKETDSAKMRVFTISFIGADKFFNRDTATIRVIVRDALNYPFRQNEYDKTVSEVNRYILQLKYTFRELDKSVKGTKNTRSTFDVASGTSALTGTALATSTSPGTQNVGKILPSVGVALVPVKEAVSPTKTYEQNSASTVRACIKRLEYNLSDNMLIGEKDPDILSKIAKIRAELKAVQVQLVDVPMVDTGGLSEEELNQYFNSPKVNKKYKLTKK
ncbi:hypothetical protein [Flavihumibacter petaseus]|uniref:Uncharacterized protein n=1 Tax=Flavihumibacter petaseus NBRC 106054 TaxID=1220578 RepID=A0A0E9N2D6_9BACT|nr:hypothetical protein [Flavihumibacter petaseus]GAO43948.1 hypothetical protein FPE01S_02_10540 [Flavihumibacter petaseus NBRC 106054]